ETDLTRVSLGRLPECLRPPDRLRLDDLHRRAAVQYPFDRRRDQRPNLGEATLVDRLARTHAGPRARRDGQNNGRDTGQQDRKPVKQRHGSPSPPAKADCSGANECLADYPAPGEDGRPRRQISTSSTFAARSMMNAKRGATSRPMSVWIA